MSDHNKDFDFELMPGVPAGLPKGEEILWQGKAQAMALAREAYKINWIAGYMLIVVLWRAGGAYADGGTALMLATGLPYLVLAVAAYGVIYLLAWAQARASIYTITSARVIMRIGAALPVTYTIPFVRIATARLDLKPGGTGTIAIEITDGVRLSYAVLWPHLRPGFARVTQPAFRCIPDAQNVARLLADAAQAKLNEPVVTVAPSGAMLAAE
ncbi:PH domain-containing protein [Pseudotabrizicola sediminis]|uniref:PH domain-containing protein n=1 Tax=Pseudotabrizicola sediminis TaxID=2486418 RepID=A0ABY2KKC2_9RHOB|nr:photosynthetic complex putative assembly protein PuhB [Pseudotabrizicola sediminis]TGD42924.1 PH domain-containing protein [Pseudotabrizicola sediminis]TGD66114.1 PH domain-containing protein [Tabrizicola sp. WMC-M-20]